MDLTSVILKVQKLLALAKSSNPNEAAAAAAAANLLLDKYRLSEVDLETQSESSISIDEDYVYESGKVTTWKLDLLRVLSTHYGVAYFNQPHWPGNRRVSRFKMCGRPDDMAITRYMFIHFMSECQKLSDVFARGKGRPFVNSYCEGFVIGLHQQLTSSRKEVLVGATQGAIEKIDSRAKEAHAYMYANLNLEVTDRTRMGEFVGDAFHAGMERGRTIQGVIPAGKKVLK